MHSQHGPRFRGPCQIVEAVLRIEEYRKLRVSTPRMCRLIRPTSGIFMLYTWQHSLIHAVSKGKTSSLSFARRMRAGVLLVLRAAHSLRG